MSAAGDRVPVPLGTAMPFAGRSLRAQESESGTLVASAYACEGVRGTPLISTVLNGLTMAHSLESLAVSACALALATTASPVPPGNVVPVDQSLPMTRVSPLVAPWVTWEAGMDRAVATRCASGFSSGP